jgi:hypothetical protein
LSRIVILIVARHINALLPFKKVKGEYYNALDGNKPSSIQSPKQNSLSVALSICYGDHQLALCADATHSSWLDHQRELAKSSERLSFSAAKLPHHGSAHDCTDSVLDYLFDSSHQNQKIAMISADGSKHHPAESVLNGLKSRSIHPYCTSLSKMCGGNKVHTLVSAASIPKDLLRQINILGAQSPLRRAQPCQGDVCIEIPPAGPVTVQREHNHPCPLRGDFDFLSSQQPNA